MAGQSARPEVKRSASDGARDAHAPEPTLESLQQENESLKKLVVTLSEMVLRRTVDQR
ncbi:hypothetical protein NML43_10435 [Rhodopseudomonas palustris]|uniref:hypothetical protein n=1 Tax=Rhodopseudomonas palustris TaxID=1076 RepID=UPI0020CFCADE|nr:hypothetical protein [Rhodopseudomonas palustris]MCP9627505.1 hypothetical protein [Rhodopseudomonas palustris]